MDGHATVLENLQCELVARSDMEEVYVLFDTTMFHLHLPHIFSGKQFQTNVQPIQAESRLTEM
jgi:hypothetical protein